MDPVQVTVDVDLQQKRGVVTRPSRHRSDRAVKTQFSQIKFVDKKINDTHGIVSVNIVVQAGIKVIWFRLSPSMNRFITSLRNYA